MRQKRRTPIATLAGAAFVIAVAAASAGAQKLSPGELATRLSGTWKLNRELSSGFAPGRNPGGPGRGARPLFATSTALPQRRGGGGSGGGGDATDLTPEERASQAAIRQIEQIAEEITITATAEKITFKDARGERSYPVDDKTVKIDVGNAKISAKSKWDKSVLKQEFSNPQSKLTQTWGIDDAGHLVLTAKVESLTLLTPERKAVFDRK